MGVHLGYVLFGLMDIPPVKLNARQVDTAKSKDELYKLSDGGGLYLLIIGGLSTVLLARRSCLLLGFIPTWLWLKLVVNVKRLKGALLLGLPPM